VVTTISIKIVCAALDGVMHQKVVSAPFLFLFNTFYTLISNFTLKAFLTAKMQ
jgi:hypothetical protein